MRVRGRWIVGGLAVLAAGAWWMQRSPWLSARLRAPIEGALARATGRSVRVGGVGGGLSGWLWLHDVGVGPLPGSRPWDLSFTAEAVGLKLDAWGLLRGRVDLSSLKAVQVKAPNLFLLKGAYPASTVTAGAALSPGAAAGARGPSGAGTPDWAANLAAGGLPPVPMDMDRGGVWLDGPGAGDRVLAREFSVSLEPDAAGGWHLRASGRPFGAGEASLSAACGPGFSALQMQANVKGLQWPAWLPPPPGLGPLRGAVNGDFEARPRHGAWPAGFDLKGSGTLEAAALQPEGGRPGCTDLRARWSLNGAQAALSRIEASYAGGRLAGEAGLDLEAGRFGATLTAQGIDLGTLAVTAGAPPNLGLSGPADLDFWAAGSLSAPAMTADLRSQGARWQDHPLTMVEAQASGGGGQWSGDGNLAWDGGKGSLSVDLDQGGLEQAAVEVASLPADWLEAWAGPGIAGRLDGTGTYSGEAGSWELAVRGTHLEVRGASVDHASLQASGDAHTAHLRMAADLPGRPALNGEADAASMKEGLWSLRSAKLYQRDRLLLQAAGSWMPGRAGAPDSLSLTVNTAALDLGLLSPDLLRAGWTGTVQGAGALDLDAGLWHGELRATALSLSHKAWSYPGGGTVRFGPGGVTVTALTLRRGEVKGKAYAPRWSGPWSAELKLDKARLAALAALSDALPRGLRGIASGTLSYSSGPQRRISAGLEFNDPLPGLLPKASGRVELRADGPRWDLRSLVLEQPQGGFLRGQGGLDLSGRTPWSGSAHWEAFQVSGLTLSGSARLSGGGGQAGRLALAPWSLSATALPALDAAFTFDAGGLSAVEGLLGTGVHWSADKAGGSWAARAEIADMDPGPWAGFFLGRGAPTALRLDGSAEGKLSAPGRPAELKFDLHEAGSGGHVKGLWRRVSGTAALSGDFKSLNLARLADAVRALGLPAPRLGGLASGVLRGGAGSLTLTASVDALVWNGKKLGPVRLDGGWAAPGVWIAEASLGDAAGPSLGISDASWRRSGRTWTATGRLKAQVWPVAICDVSADLGWKLTGGGGKALWSAQCDSLQVGKRLWTKLALGGSWDGVRYTLKERSRRPTLSAEGSVSGGAFVLEDLQAFSGNGRGKLKGRVGKDGSLDFEGSSSGLPAADLAGMMGWPQDWTGSAWGTLKVSGNTGHAHTVVSAKVEDGSVQGLPFDLGTGYVVQDGDWVYLSPADPIRISRRDGTALEVGGKVTLVDDPAPGQGMDVWAESRKGGLRLFAGLPAITSAEGSLTLKLRFRGKPADPRVDGSFLLSDGHIDPAWLLPPLEKAEIFAQIKDSQVVLQKAEARVVGDGPLLKLEAADPLRPAFVFKDWVPAEMNLRIRASKSGIPVRFTDAMSFVSGLVHPDLVLSGSWDRPSLGGTVSLEKGGQDKAVVEWPAQVKVQPKPGEPGWFDRINYDMLLRARSDVMVRTGAAEVFVDTGDAGVRVQGAGDDKTLSGHIRLVEGSVDYLLATFRLTQDHDSWVEMRGAEPAEVELWGRDDLGSVSTGEGAPQDVQVLLHAWGPLGSVQMRLEANDPSLSQEQLASLVGMGTDAGDPRSQGGFTRMLGAVPAGILSSWGRKTGLFDEVGLRLPAVEQSVAEPTPDSGGTGQVVPLAESTPVTGTAKALVEVSVGKYVGSKLFLGMNTEVMEHTDPLGKNQVDPEVGGVIEYQLPDSSSLSVEHNVDTSGQTDNRVMLEGSTRFENYNPSRRRWDGSYTPTPDPSPGLSAADLSPSPTPSPTPSPSPP